MVTGGTITDQLTHYVATVGEETKVFPYAGWRCVENSDCERAFQEAYSWVMSFLPDDPSAVMA